jgi:hypothetical protein
MKKTAIDMKQQQKYEHKCKEMNIFLSQSCSNIKTQLILIHTAGEKPLEIQMLAVVFFCSTHENN